MNKDNLIIITEADAEEMCRLAEDVMQELYMNFAQYDAEGNDIYVKHDWRREDYKKEIEALREDPNERLLYDLFRRGDEIGKVRYYTLEEIRPWIEPIIPKAIQIFRKGTADGTGETTYAAAETVPDDYLIAMFAREVRNMMMIFAGQQMQKEDIARYLLLLEHPRCHDADEWAGIYFDDENLKKAYDELAEELEKLRETDRSYRPIDVAIWEFRPMQEWKEKPVDDTGYIRPKQKIRPVKPEELQCFKECKKRKL